MAESSGNQQVPESSWGICHARGEPKNVQELVKTWLHGPQDPAHPDGLHHEAPRLPPYLLLVPPQGSDVGAEQVKALSFLKSPLKCLMVVAGQFCSGTALLVQSVFQCRRTSSGLASKIKMHSNRNLFSALQTTLKLGLQLIWHRQTPPLANLSWFIWRSHHTISAFRLLQFLPAQFNYDPELDCGLLPIPSTDSYKLRALVIKVEVSMGSPCFRTISRGPSGKWLYSDNPRKHVRISCILANEASIEIFLD